MKFIRSIKIKNIFIPTTFVVLLSFSSTGMEEAGTNTLDVPRPPVVTYGQYANNLVIGESIEEWGDLSGNLGAWLQKTANKNRVSTQEGKPIPDLPLFLLTLNPRVEGDRLRADYILSPPQSDLGNGPATLSLFLDVSKDVLQAAAQLPQESFTDLAVRLLEWQNQYYKCDVLARTVGEELLEMGLFNKILLFGSCLGRQLRSSSLSPTSENLKILILANAASAAYRFMGILSQNTYTLCLGGFLIWYSRELYYASGAFREAWNDYSRIRSERG